MRLAVAIVNQCQNIVVEANIPCSNVIVIKVMFFYD